MQKIVRWLVKFGGYLLILFGLNYVGDALVKARYDDSEYVEVGVLKTENNLLKEKLQEIEEVKALLPSYVLVQVVERDLYSFYDEVVVNSTEAEVGNAVVDSSGLIGIVTKVNKRDSNVTLLSGNVKVSVKINNSYGILSNGVVTMLDKYEKIVEGDQIFTSGLTKIPGDIYVGTVNSVYSSVDNLTQEATVNLLENNNLNFVAILKEAS